MNPVITRVLTAALIAALAAALEAMSTLNNKPEKDDDTEKTDK